MPDDSKVQPDTKNPNSQARTLTLSDFEAAWGALAETWMADGEGQHLLLARQNTPSRKDTPQIRALADGL